jgi:hypothetical protein
MLYAKYEDTIFFLEKRVSKAGVFLLIKVMHILEHILEVYVPEHLAKERTWSKCTSRRRG